MTRKDFEKIAAIIRANTPLAPNRRTLGGDAIEINIKRRTAQTIAYSLADMLAADNPRFDRAKFLKACGLEG
jgi:hypothetical protein